MFDYRPVDAPYPGLRPFEAHESEIFFGREGHTDRLLEILQREHFLAVIGPSGSGKSSLVRAGLLPGLACGALGTGSHWRLALLRPGAQPMLALAQALLDRHGLAPELLDAPAPVLPPGEVSDDAALLAADLRLGPTAFERLLASAAAARAEDSPPVNLLILVDQFEEVFSYHDAAPDPDEAGQFVDLLLTVAKRPELRVFVALTMRTDFLGHCVAFTELPEAINRAQYLTPRLREDELRQAICGPARVFGGEVDPPFADRIIARLGTDPDQLPMVQHALACWWREAVARNADAPLIDESASAAVGDVDEALDRHAEALFEALAPALQATAEALFRAITEGRAGGDAVRRPQRLDAISEWSGIPQAELEAVIVPLAEPQVSFLHYGAELAAASVIDLSHEALMRQWRRLAGWIEDERQRGAGFRRWNRRAAEYADRASGPLVGADLARALEWWSPGLEDSNWRPDPAWAARYAEAREGTLDLQLERLRRLLVESRDSERRAREAERVRLEAQAKEERQRADRERGLAEAAQASKRRAQRMSLIAALVAVLAVAAAAFGWWQKARARQAEQVRTASLFDSQLTHASLLARVEDYAGARATLSESVAFDASIRPSRRHARNLLAGAVDIRGARSERVYEGAGAALSGGVAVSPDGRWLAAAGERATLVLFDANSGQLSKRLSGDNPMASGILSIRAITFSPDGQSLYSASISRRIIRWSLPDGKKRDLWYSADPVWALTLSPDGRMLASGDKKGVITLWSLPDGTKLQQLKGHAGAISDSTRALDFSPDGRWLASASYDRTARIWDLGTGKTPRVLHDHANRVNGAAFSPNGELLATSSADGRIVLWDAKSGALRRILTGHHKQIFGIAFDADGSRLFSASRDKTVRQWDVASGQMLRIYQGHEAGLWSVATKGEWLYSASDDGTLRRWSLSTPGQWLWEIGEAVDSTAIAPDGSKVAVGLAGGELRLYQLPEGKLLAKVAEAHNAAINRIAFSPDGHKLATGSADDTDKLWTLQGDDAQPSLRAEHTISKHQGSVCAVAFSPDGRRLATASDDGRVGLFGADTGEGRTVAAHDGSVVSVSFDESGTKLLSAGGDDFRLRLWDPNRLDAPPREIARQQDALLWASLAPDGRQLAGVGRGGSKLTLVDLDRPDQIRRLVGHDDAVFRAIYSPDGRQLATVSGDMTLRLWDLERERELVTLRLPTEDQSPSPLWDFDFRCTDAGVCWIAVPLTMGRVAVYRLPYENPPPSLSAPTDNG